MVGRRREQELLSHWLHSPRSEFVVTYGRRRVGKTYLIDRFFRGSFAFRATGADRAPKKKQLELFNQQLIAYGSRDRKAPANWIEAFARLCQLLDAPEAHRDPESGKLVIFIDEMPWFDTQKSDFKVALEYFWNTWVAPRDDVLLIACGSASSWLTKNLLNNTEGLYRRVTGRLHVLPFTLGEAEELLRYNQLELTRQHVIELYLVFGGIPYYLNLVRHGQSPAQAIDSLCFAEGAPLEGEYEMLFRSLFKQADRYLAVIDALAHKTYGITNAELRTYPNVPQGSSLSTTLEDLELCGFVRSEEKYQGGKNGKTYRLIDPYVCFYQSFLKQRAFDRWSSHAQTASYVAWRGIAFERCCLAHVRQIKRALEIGGVEAKTGAWQGEYEGRSAQVDLYIDRKDGIVDICEAKCTSEPYALGKDAYDDMCERLAVFRGATGTTKALHLVLVSANGVRRTPYLASVQKVVVGDDLFIDAN